MHVCGISEGSVLTASSKATPKAVRASEAVADPTPAMGATWRIQRFLERCSEALDRDLNAPFAHYLLIELLKTPDLPESVRVPLFDVSMRWLRANWLHRYFSPTLDAFVKVLAPGPQAREELVKLVVRKLRAVRPGVSSARRNRTLLRLLGQQGEVASEVVVSLTDALLDRMDEVGQAIVSAEVLRRLTLDLLPGSERRYKVENAIGPVMRLDPGPLSVASDEVKALIDTCFGMCYAMLTAESLPSQDLRPLVDTLERLAAEGHLYRCRHVVTLDGSRHSVCGRVPKRPGVCPW